MIKDSVFYSSSIKDLKIILSTKSYSKIGVLVDENTHTFCYPLIAHELPDHHLLHVPAGEVHKTIESCELIWQQLTDLKFNRDSILFVLGGGVLGDMGGFCAATFKRGIDFVLIPTTLLAQADACVGGKLGIDFKRFKNHIGVFCQPIGTIIYSSFLNTLPERELRSGFAEVIKHCLISDRAMWKLIRTKNLVDQDWNTLVEHSVLFKRSVIEKDPYENGLRKILNFGHTIGHALESYFLDEATRIFHGEAIAMGMIMESFIAQEKKLISANELEEIVAYLLKIFGKQSLSWDHAEVIDLIAQDKKNRGNEILLALPAGIGKAEWDVPVSEEELLASFSFYQSLQT